MNYARDIINALDTIRTITGIPINYYRGNAYVPLTAKTSKSVQLADDNTAGISVDTTARDYLIKASLLVIGGVRIEPAREDLIKERVGNKIHIYEVRRPDGNSQVWSYTDSFRDEIRVYTILSEVVDA